MTTKIYSILLSVAFYAATPPLLQADSPSRYDELEGMSMSYSRMQDSLNGTDEQFKNNCLQYVKGKMYTSEAEDFCSKLSHERRYIIPEPDRSSWKPVNNKKVNPSYRGRTTDNDYEVKIFDFLDSKPDFPDHKQIISGIKQQAELYGSKNYRNLIADLEKNGISLSFPVFTYTQELPEQSVAISFIKVRETYEKSIESSLLFAEAGLLIKNHHAFFKRIGKMLAILDKHLGPLEKNDKFNILQFISSQHALNHVRISSDSLVIPIAEAELYKNTEYRNFKTYAWFIGYENYKLAEGINSDKRLNAANSKIADFAVRSFETIRDSYLEFIRTNTDEEGYFHGTKKKPLMEEVDFEDLLTVLEPMARHEGIYSVCKTNKLVGFDPGKMDLDKLKTVHSGL